MKAPQRDFRIILKEELEQRCSKNPRYSMRSFARDLGLAPARLSDVLRGRYGLSRAAGESIAKSLGYSKSEITRFCDLIDSEHARDPKKRSEALQRVEQKQDNYRQLSLDGFQVISEWYHYAILELTLIEGFRSDSAWIAKQLGISQLVAQAAVERLLRLDLLLRDDHGVLIPSEGMTSSPDGVPSESIKKFHRQILQKAIQAIDLQNIEERDFSNVILAIDEEQIPQAKESIRKFRREFDLKFGRTQKKNRIYNLSVQFFCLQEKNVK